MPRSKSKRRRYQPPPKPKPPPSPPWVPVLFFVLIGLGFVIILARYIFAVSLPILDRPWILFVGLGLIAAAFVVATRWR
ncbi:MAG: cell division protein CrgA [Actinomycetota bacterium]